MELNATIERDRARNLIEAERRAQLLFTEVGRRALVAPGRTESEVSDAAHDLGAELFGTNRHWHRPVVRAGPNTLTPYREHPPERIIAHDDVVFMDCGPIFAEWEADVGRTFVLGHDPDKVRLPGDLARIFAAGQEYFAASHDITGARLYHHIVALANNAGWEFGGWHSGHLVGEFPHQTIAGGKIESDITPGNPYPMRRRDRAGQTWHWILEVRLVDRERQFGGFFEQLLTLDAATI